MRTQKTKQHATVAFVAKQKHFIFFGEESAQFARSKCRDSYSHMQKSLYT